MRYKSPLRYPGGKAKLAEFVKLIFRSNRLLDGTYVEPYAGGASVALALLFEEYASSVHINDVDPGVHAFWSAALNETEALCRLVRDTRVTPREWKRQKEIYSRIATQPILAGGFAAFFLNRTNRSGIIASGGMIGGRDQGGHWKLDARYNRPELVDRIQRIARYRDRIRLTNLDALDFLERISGTLPRKSLIYLDPPYFVKGTRRLYANFYEARDHAYIADRLKSLPCHWLVSYDNAPQVRRLYRHFRKITYRLRYTAAERQRGSEIMVFSNDLIIQRENLISLELGRFPPVRAAV